MELEKNSNGKSKRRCFNQTSHLFYSEETEHMLARDIAAEARCSGTGRAQCTNVSGLKLSEESLLYLGSSLDADLEIYYKQKMRVGCAQLDENKEEVGVWGRACDDMHCSCSLCDDCRQSHFGEDSQLKYLSAHEQDFDDRNSSREFSEQREIAGIKNLKLVDPEPEVPGGGVTQEQNVVDMSEDCSTFEYGNTCSEAAMADLPHLPQDCMSLLDCSGMVYYNEEEQTKYHSVICGSVLESPCYGSKERDSPNLLVCDSLGDAEVKDIPLTDGTLPPHIATGEEASEKNVHSVSVKEDSPLPSPTQRASAFCRDMQFCSLAGDFDFCSGEELGVCVRGASCVDCTAEDAETTFPVSEILTSTNPCSGAEVAEKSSHGNTSSLNWERCETLEKITSISTVNQAVDASSDFRACFTTSRSISAEVCLTSRAMNTEIRMMSKSEPMGWHHETCADVACNTDWSCGASSTEEVQSQLTDTLEKSSGGNTATAGRSSHVQEQQESKNELRNSNVKTSTDRLVDLDKQAVKNSASSYCQTLLQRAIEAELQVLDAHYQMCYQHCLKSYNLALERSMCCRRCKGNTELCSSVMSALKELKKNYSSMRMQIKGGVPLNTLPPLSVEMLLPVSSYVPCKLFRGDLCSDSFPGKRTADFEAPPQRQERKISVDMTLCLTDGGQPSDCPFSKTLEEQDKDEDMQCGCMKNEENEGWSDAKEDLTDTNFSVIYEETQKQTEKQDTVDLRAKRTESGNECSFIRGGGQSSSVSEGDSRSHFQKNQISDTLISQDSSNYRYTRLSCNDTNKAKLAVEEMNQKKMKGNPVSVEFVSTSPENKYVVSQVLTNEPSCEIQPVDNGQRSDQDKRLTSASSSVQAPDATAASKKTHLLPVTTSKSSCSTQAPSETKCPGLKSSTEVSDTGENLLKETSVTLSTKSHDTFISSNILNLSSFAKLMKKLQEIHPETSKDKIVDALVEVRKNNGGILCGLSLSAIMESVSKILQKSTSSCGWEKQCK